MSEFYEEYLEPSLNYCGNCGGNYHSVNGYGIVDIKLIHCTQCHKQYCGYCIDDYRICVRCEHFYYRKRNIFQKIRDLWYYYFSCCV